MFVAGAWETARLKQATALTFRAQWQRSGGKYSLTRSSADRKSSMLAAKELRVRAWDESIEILRKEVARFRDEDVTAVAERYAEAVEDYVRRYNAGLIPAGPNFSTPTVEHHPMRTLALELVFGLGAKELAGIAVGDRAVYSNLRLPGVRDLKGYQRPVASFERASAAVADRFAHSAQDGELAQVNGMRWLLGSVSSWLPVKGVSLIVTSWGDEAWATVVIDRGNLETDGYMERIPLRHGGSDLAGAFAAGENLREAVEWSSATMLRYPRLGVEPEAAANRTQDATLPESYAVADVLRALQTAVNKPVLALLPVGLEAQVAVSFKPVTSLRDALEVLGRGYYGLELIEAEGGVVLRPRTPTLGPWEPRSAQATRAFVSSARKRADFGSDDLAQYIASLDMATFGTAEPAWWENALIREGLPARARVGNKEEYRLLGMLLGLAEDGGKWKYATAPASIQSAVQQFGYGNVLWREGEASSLLTAEASSGADWSKATILLVRRRVPAAMLRLKAESVLPPRTLASYLDDYQPGYPDHLNPTKLRLVEGTMTEFEVRLEFAGGEYVSTVFSGRFAPTRDEVVGIAALSEELRSAIEEARTPPPTPYW